MADYLSPSTVQERLGVKGAGLRRLATLYERVYGPLPRDQRHGRLYPEEAVQRLEHARDDVDAGRYGSIEAALRGVVAAEGVEVRADQHAATLGALAALTEEVRALRGEVRELAEENRALRDRLPELEPPEPRETGARTGTDSAEGVRFRADDTGQPRGSQEPAGESPRRPWWRRLLGGG